MTYLRRRIEHLVELIQSGRLHFLEGDPQQEKVIEDLLKVKRHESGEIDLETCSPLVRSFSRMVHNLTGTAGRDDEPEKQPRSFEVSDVAEYQREYFSLLDEVFRRMFGKAACDFAHPNDFVDEMKRLSGDRRQNFHEHFRRGFSELYDFHGKHMLDAFAKSKCLHGMKLVLGGTSRFSPAQLGGLRQTMLYADTFLIPDPVLPWLEEVREEERFRHIEYLRQIHMLLHLKPLIDADTSYPAVAVFPSFERLLMKNDAVTKDGMSRLLLDFFGHYVGRPFEDETEIVQYVEDNETDFLNLVEKKNLFIAPEETIGVPLREMLVSYRREIQTWRTQEHVDLAASLPDGLLAFQGIAERLQPHYHLRENAGELDAQPMMCLEQHAHYFKLCADIFNDSLVDSAAISAKNLSALRALQQPKFRWLTNVPIEVLAKLRADGENENFRRRIAEHVSQLHECKLDDLDAVSYEVCRGINSLLKEHDKRVESIERNYQKKFAGLATKGWLGIAATLYPSLAPFVGTAGASALGAVGAGALGVSYVKAKIEQLKESRQVACSLTGVLAKAQHEDN